MKKYEKPMITDVIKLSSLMTVTVASEPGDVANKGTKDYENVPQLSKGNLGSVWDK